MPSAAERALAGMRVVVTRPREQAAELVAGLERLGADAAVVPLIAVEVFAERSELDDLLERGGHDWVVFTSANAVRAVGERIRRSRARVAAVGPATAEELGALGVGPSFVPERFAAAAIADGLGPLEGVRVLLPQSEIAEPSLVDELRARGAVVDAVTAYRTVALEPGPEEAATLRAADAILLASGSAARALAAAVVPRKETLLVCIGPATAEAARSAGLRVGLVAEEATGEGMIQALVEHVREHP